MPTLRSIGAACLLLLPAIAALPTTPLSAAEEDGVRVSMKTTLGEIVLELNPRLAPLSVDNFLRYADEGFYDGTIFHRVIDGFMIQGGGFTSEYRRKGTHSPIRNEANNGLPNRRYSIAMARTNEPHSASSQFFINTVDNQNLDHTSPDLRGWGYTVFGQVVEGQEVVDAISRVATGPAGPFSRDVPRDTISIVSVSRIDDMLADADEPADESAEADGADQSDADDTDAPSSPEQ